MGKVLSSGTPETRTEFLIQEFLNYLERETDYGSWDEKVKEEIKIELRHCLNKHRAFKSSNYE